MNDKPKRGLVAGHADFAAGLIGAVEMISGCGDVLIPIQVRGLCGDDIQKLLYDTCMESGVRVIFTDLQAGSCTMASRRVLKQLGEGVLVAGANLPMLLDFAMSSNENAIEAASTAAERGRAAVSVHGAPP
ncbi:MAG: phosphotransferase system enzyme component [Gemmatimonadetes bacterium]|nr:phosphotransferase system enzyme component [Gemmatimonadota bacterium]